MIRQRVILTPAIVVAAAVVALTLLILRSPTPPESTPIPTVAATPKVVTVPDVNGFTKEQAEAALTDVGLEIESQLEVSPTVVAGKVIRTAPGAGSLVEEGTRVVMFVSAGP